MDEHSPDHQGVEGTGVNAPDHAAADDQAAYVAPSERELVREDIEQEKRAESEGMTP